MPTYHFLLVLSVVIIWGCNFVFIKLGLKEISPLLFCAIRFTLASFPAILFMKRPDAPFKIVILYGLLMFGLQFSLIFMSMHVGMTPGMASLLMQTQVFFSIFFAFLFINEIPSRWQIIGACISFSGIALVAMHFDKSISLLGFMLIISAAATWGVGNLITKKIGHVNMISLVVWGSFIASFPLWLLSLTFEGVDSIIHSIHHLSLLGGVSVLYIVYVSTLIGYGVWNWLISRYPVAVIVPFTLLVPIFGMVSSALVFNEPLQAWKIAAGILVIAGLCISFLGARFFASKNLKMASEL